MRYQTILVAVLISSLASGCAKLTHYKSGVDLTRTGYSVDAKQRFVFSVPDRRSPENRIVCAEPSPDALSAVAANFGASASVIGQGSGQAAGALAEQAGSIGLRTATITLLRDAFYRVCEGYMNNATDRFGYAMMMTAIDDTVLNIMAIESLTGTFRADSLALSGKAETPSLNLTVTETIGESGNAAPAAPAAGGTPPATNSGANAGSTTTQNQTSAGVSGNAAISRAGAGEAQNIEAVTNAVLEIVKNDTVNSFGNLVAACAFALGADGSGKYGVSLTKDFKAMCLGLLADARIMAKEGASSRLKVAEIRARTAEIKARTAEAEAQAKLVSAQAEANK